MGTSTSGHRVAYDRIWGAFLLATAMAPVAAGSWAWSVEGDPVLTAWLVGGTGMGVLAVVLGFSGIRSRTRHAINFFGGCALVATPLLVPRLWERFPTVNPARLPLADVGGTGWVMLIALGAVYAGAGVRVARPTQFLGMALGTPGALVATIFACLPEAVGGSGYASERILVFANLRERWQELLPTLLGAAGVTCAIFNMVRNPAEVMLARISRILVVGALLVTLMLPFEPVVAWGAMRFFAPLFLAIDAAIAFTAISITRTQD